jgi:hypothetical protein
VAASRSHRHDARNWDEGEFRVEMNDMVIISVDDHISEPPDLFKNHLTGADLESAPKLVTDVNGGEMWVYQGQQFPCVGLNAVVGRPFEEYGMEPTSLEQMRKGVYDVHARIEDMDVNGVAASLNFGSVFDFAGGRLATSRPTTTGTSMNGAAPIRAGSFPAASSRAGTWTRPSPRSNVCPTRAVTPSRSTRTPL